MSGPRPPQQIEIIEPISEPLVSRATEADVVARDPGVAGPSVVAEFVTAAHERLEPVRARGRRVERSVHAIVQWSAGRRRQRVADGNPRHDSRVRQHVFIPFAEVAGRFRGAAAEVEVGGTRLRLTSPFELQADGALRAEARLELRASWPPLPLWITLEPFWRSRTVATASLRSTRRLRYPRRYFSSAHRALRDLVDAS